MWYVPHWCNDRAKSRENSCYNIRRCSCGGFSGYIVAICKEFEEETWWYELCSAIRSDVLMDWLFIYLLLTLLFTYILYALTNNFAFWLSFTHFALLLSCTDYWQQKMISEKAKLFFVMHCFCMSSRWMKGGK